jgi:hypothetical protein
MINGQIDTNTITIYTLIENGFDFGLKDYPIFNEDYRTILNAAILDFYLFHEIGFINANVFKHYLNNRMTLIMRNKYNALYSAKAKDFNPLYTLDVYDEYSHTVENTNSGEINSTSNSTNETTASNNITVNTDVTSNVNNDTLALASNYPSSKMVSDDLTSDIYVNNGQKNKGTTNSTDNTDETTTSSGTNNSTNIGTDKTTNSGNAKTTETYSKHSYGSASDLSFAHAMVQFKDYCDKFDLDLQIISELSDLFYNIY